jgi:mono/diheme cytochrome c family protein
MGPRLNAGSLVVQAADPSSLINVILYGPDTAGVEDGPRWLKPMRAYRYLLDDAEVAALASFLRSSWDNRAGAVTPDQVASQR